ncbi:MULTISPECIES: DUF4375 domain-containing protein [unclassified Sphingobacterium]|uniref:DMP19 family protein n=1 Tax=unclassified Sphingobacterium TaxID=2609468 RepID=UPI001046283E|nr:MULTISPECIES: DUF4375 domain-containing protein [unclassified Sphingobacterium]MCS3556938.1 hypothetical protein [Sphingobacterium sp. JUb21]TCQ98942.1 uncharacterized protein DUF4375 [Sphingobacterium sp. JUb20]
MGLITVILNLFGCTGQTNKNVSGLTKEIEEQLTQSVEAFKNRPIHKELTEQIIDTTSDENLLQVVFDNLSEKIPTDYEKEYETIMGWNKSRQAIYMIWVLEAEVNNGGYNQFYFNSSGQFTTHLSEALRLVGANKFAELTKRANDTFEKENLKITQNKTVNAVLNINAHFSLCKHNKYFFDKDIADLNSYLSKVNNIASGDDKHSDMFHPHKGNPLLN